MEWNVSTRSCVLYPEWLSIVITQTHLGKSVPVTLQSTVHDIQDLFRLVS